MNINVPLYELCHIYRRFGSTIALRDVNFTLSAGESVALLGPNGAGKTTLLRAMATSARPTRGSLHAFGVDPWSAKGQVRSRIGVVAHVPYVYPELTCIENLTFFGTMFGVEDPDGKARVTLERVGLAGRSGDRAGALSRGLLQRLNLARAVIHDPAVLLLDEPDTGLDASGRDVLSEIMSCQVDRGGGVVMTTHALDYALEAASRIVLLVDGRVVMDELRAGIDLGRIESLIAVHAPLAGR